MILKEYAPRKVKIRLPAFLDAFVFRDWTYQALLFSFFLRHPL